MKRHGTTTISIDRLAEILHSTISFDAAMAIDDDKNDGTVPGYAYLQTVGITDIVVEDEDVVVSWEALVHERASA